MKLLCSKCGEDKPAGAFYKRGDSDRYRSHCRACLKRSPTQRARRRARHAQQPERHILEQMIQRCHNPKNPAFKNYGKRGITVCNEWRDSFDAFLSHIGPRPSAAHTVERRENDRGYEPGNVRWATRAEQNRNTRQNVLITLDGQTLCRAAWSERSGVPAKAIRDRMERLGWGAARAIFTPVRPQKRRAA